MTNNPNLVSVPIVDKNGKQTTVRRRMDQQSSGASNIPRVDTTKRPGFFAGVMMESAIREKLEDKSNLYANPFINFLERKTLGADIQKAISIRDEGKANVKSYLRMQKGTTQLARTLGFIERVTEVADGKGDYQGGGARAAVATLMGSAEPGEFELLTANEKWITSQPDQKQAIISFGTAFRTVLSKRMELINHVANHAEASSKYKGPYKDYFQDTEFSGAIHTNAEKHGTSNVSALISLLNQGPVAGFSQQEMNKFF